MAKPNPPAFIGTPVSPEPNPSFSIGRVFIKELTFDANPASNFKENVREQNPEIKYELRVEHKALDNNVYEIDFVIQATAKINAVPVFTCGLKQTGFFTVTNCTEQQLDFILKGYCPTILFPYARENLSNIMVRSGFKPFELPAIDFLSVYQKTLEAEVAKRNPAKP